MPVQIPNVFLEGIYKFNVQGEEHSYHPRRTQLSPQKRYALRKFPIMLKQTLRFLVGFFFFTFGGRTMQHVPPAPSVVCMRDPGLWKYHTGSPW